MKEKKSLSYQKKRSTSSSESDLCPPAARPRLSSGGSTEILEQSFSSSPSPSSVEVLVSLLWNLLNHLKKLLRFLILYILHSFHPLTMSTLLLLLFHLLKVISVMMIHQLHPLQMIILIVHPHLMVKIIFLPMLQIFHLRATDLRLAHHLIFHL